MECSNGKYRLSTKNTIYSAQEKYTRWRALFPGHASPALTLRADLEKVAAAFPAMIRGKKGLQEHIIANFRRSAMILSGISTVFCARLKRRGYESICDLGEVMRWKNQY
jgi:hypothetical protein